MEYIIRPVTSADVDELREISLQTFNDSFASANTAENMNLYNDAAFNPVQLLDEINNPESFFYFAIENDIAIGYLKLNTGNAQGDLKDENSLELARIYVRKAFQGQHIGKELLDTAIEITRQKNKDFIWLGVWENNPGAIRFYERHGFQQFSKHSFMLGTDRQTDILMKRIIL